MPWGVKNKIKQKIMLNQFSLAWFYYQEKFLDFVDENGLSPS